MSNAPETLSKRQRQREATRGRRLAIAERRRTVFELIVSGHSYEAIARETGLSPSALRRDVGKAIAARAIEAPERYVHLQVARIEKALLAVDAAIERGDVRAVSQYLKPSPPSTATTAWRPRWRRLSRPPRPPSRACPPPRRRWR
jgi:transposase-like protein